MVFGLAAGDSEAKIGEGTGECLCVFDDLLLVGFELWLECFSEGDGFGGDDVHEGAALDAGEDIAVDEFVEFFVVGHDEAAAGATQRFMCCCGDDVGVWEGRWVLACGDEACDVCDVGHEGCTDFVCDLSELGEVNCAGVGGVATEDHFGFVLVGGGADGFVVDLFVLGVLFVVVECVVDWVVEDS